MIINIAIERDFGWYKRTRWKGVSNDYPKYDPKQSDGEVLVRVK